MRPIFTIHAGEFIVGEYIEKHFRDLNVWIPSKDTGVDLLVTRKDNTSRSVSLQVKLSRDYKPSLASSDFDKQMIAGGWLSLSHKKIEESTAEFWVFVLVSHERKIDPQYIVIPPYDLLQKLVKIHGKSKNYHFYPWVLNSKVALQGRGLSKEDKQLIADDNYELKDRDLSCYLSNWKPLIDLV